MMVYPPRAVGDVVRLWADALGVPHGEYIASVLAERFGHPYWASPEVRTVDGGLPAMLDGVELPRHLPAAGSWDERDVFVTKPVLALGRIIRDVARSEKRTMTSLITDELAGFHGIDLENRTVAAHVDGDPLGIDRDLRLRREVQRLLA